MASRYVRPDSSVTQMPSARSMTGRRGRACMGVIGSQTGTSVATAARGASVSGSVMRDPLGQEGVQRIGDEAMGDHSGQRRPTVVERGGARAGGSGRQVDVAQR